MELAYVPRQWHSFLEALYRMDQVGRFYAGKTGGRVENMIYMRSGSIVQEFPSGLQTEFKSVQIQLTRMRAVLFPMAPAGLLSHGRIKEMVTMIFMGKG